MYKNLIITVLILFIQSTQAQVGTSAIYVNAGDNQGLISARENANNGTAWIQESSATLKIPPLISFSIIS